ncbi:WD domain-containing protein [Diplocarpon rosae]|nr:WD domain-containing protein [Diplocarpon rosae]
MKNALVAKGPKVTINDVPIPKPAAGQVLIRVIYSGSNPKDWKLPEYGEAHNSGDDIAGIVESIGDDVVEFKKGDRVAAFHEMMSPHGSFAEYAIAWDYTTFHLPKKISFEEGASIPLAAMTAAVGLYLRLGLPDLWKPTTVQTPLIVYGASSAVGAYAIKLAQASNIHPIIAIAGRAQAFVEKLITRGKGDTIVDYREGDQAVVSGIKEALKKVGTSDVKYAFDAVSEHNSFQNIGQVLSKQGSKITLVLPGMNYSDIPGYIEKSTTLVGIVHTAPSHDETQLGLQTGGREFGHAYFKLFTRGLQEGWLSAHPHEVIPGGLNGLEQGLSNLKNGVNSGTKYCHVSSDGSRLATAAGDGHVRIWSTEAILHAGDPSYTKPKQLCHMSYHSGTIHTVRFSPNGRWLASGADDKIICIYALDTNPPSHSATFGSNEPPPVENWKIMKRLIGHDNDVQDLGWAYDSSILVSVGLDSKIVVWSGHTFEKLKTLSVHQSHVKGITFDPANKYFATASDDRSIKLFRFTSPLPNASSYDSINNFVLDHTIVNPFTSSPLTTYFRRCSWSPDGNHIAAANAVNGPVSSVAIINRGGWDSDINLIGHEGPTEVCTFSPRLFSKHEISAENTDNSGYSTQPLVTVIACAGQDKTLSIWNTSSSRPLVVLQDLAGKSISDLAWTPDGLAIFATSLDGSIVALQFEGGELGFIAPWAENDKALQKFGAGRRGVGVVEDVAGLRLEEMSKAGELQKTEGRMGALMGDASTDHVPVLNGNGTSTPMVGVTSTAPVVTNGRPAQESPASSAPPAPAVDPNAAKLEAMKSRVTITKDGKKRVAPLLVSSSGTGLSSLPQSQLMAANSNNAQNDAPQSVLDLSKPYDGLPRGGLAAMLLGNKRKAILVDGEEEEEQPNKRPTLGSGPVSIMVNGVNGLEAATAAPPMTGVVPTPEYLRPAVLNPSLSISQVRLSVPKIRSHILRSLDRGTLPPSKSSGANATNGVEESAIATDDIILEAQNPPTVIGQVRDPSRISASKRGATIWHDYLPRAIILVTGNKNLWAAACEDGSIYTWSPAGRRTTNAMVLEAQPVILECRGWWLLCITAVGMCYVWNLKTLTSPHPPVSLAPILEIAMHSLGVHTTSAPGVTSAHLNSTGRIIVTLSNGDGYLYSPNMYVWQRLSEAWWAVGSQYWNSNDSSISSLQSTGVGPDKQRDGEFERSNISAGIIPHLERHTTNEVLLKGRAYTLQRLVKTLLSREGFEGFESGVSIAHLENRVAAAMQLDAREEFRIYLFMYAKRLGAEGLKAKVEELLRSIMGGILKEGGDAMEESEKICGWDRKELLKEVVLILGKFRDLQRLTVQYARVLEMNVDENGA